MHREMCREVSSVRLDRAERSRTLVPLSDRLCGGKQGERERDLELIFMYSEMFGFSTGL